MGVLLSKFFLFVTADHLLDAGSCLGGSISRNGFGTLHLFGPLNCALLFQSSLLFLSLFKYLPTLVNYFLGNILNNDRVARF